MSGEVKLTAAERRDLRSFDGRGVIAFSQFGSGVGFRRRAWAKRMASLQNAGLVEPSPFGDFYITPAGRHALETEGGE